jgi:hypothetical protein
MLFFIYFFCSHADFFGMKLLAAEPSGMFPRPGGQIIDDW